MVHCLEEVADSGSEETGSQEELFKINSTSRHQPYRVSLDIEGELVEMEIDTGASLSIMSEQEFLNLWPERSVVATDVTLHSYSGECIPVVGSIDVCVSYKGQKITLPLVIVRGVGPSLLGRNWLQNMQFNWQEIFWSNNATLEKVLEQYFLMDWVR